MPDPNTSRALRVLFFSLARLVTGTEKITLPCEKPIDERAFWKKLLEVHPGLEEFQAQFRLARNGEFIRGGEIFEPGDEVAVIPPVSGG